MTPRVLFVLFATMQLGACGQTFVFDPPSVPLLREPRLPVAPGTRVQVVLTEDLSSGTGFPGRFVVLADVTGQVGETIVPAGSEVLVRVTDHSARGIGRPGSLQFDVLGTHTPDGRWVALQGRAEVEGVRRRGKAVGLTVGMSFLYFPLSLFHLAHRGAEAVAHRGLVIEAVVMP